ncbi:hypothetical protein FKP32DRAFT_1171813 [Trametes sanguinea]|nr:hypothetical protein FKP32DRAFT_1171813 [Trametes sanguinea]
MMGAVALTIALFILQTYTTRTQALSEARHNRRTPSRGTASSSSSPDLDEAQRISLDARTDASIPEGGSSARGS